MAKFFAKLGFVCGALLSCIDSAYSSGSLDVFRNTNVSELDFGLLRASVYLDKKLTFLSQNFGMDELQYEIYVEEVPSSFSSSDDGSKKIVISFFGESLPTKYEGEYPGEKCNQIYNVLIGDRVKIPWKFRSPKYGDITYLPKILDKLVPIEAKGRPQKLKLIAGLVDFSCRMDRRGFGVAY